MLASAQSGAIDGAIAEYYAAALPEEFKQAVKPDEAITDIGIIESLGPDSVRLQLEPGEVHREAFLTWYLGGVSASLSQLLPVLQCMGVEVLEERPFAVTRPEGLTVWIYQFKIRRRPRSGTGRERRLGIDRRPVHRRRHRDLGRTRRGRPFQRTGPAGRPDLAASHAANLRQIPAPGRIPPQPVPHRVGAGGEHLHRAFAGHAV